MKTQEWTTSEISGDPRADERNVGSFAGTSPEHTLALDLVPVTEAAALAAGRWVGHGDEDSGKAAAVDALHEHLASVSMQGVVVLGGGRKRLTKGEEIGSGTGPVCDVVISAGDGALSIARDVPNALTAIAVAERGALYDLSSVRYLDKLAVGPECADVVDIDRPVAENLRAVADAKGIRVSDVRVAVLNRTRHQELAQEIRAAGARVHLIEGGDIAAAIATARPESPVDLLLGTGGAAEGVIAAVALSCLGGALQARPRLDESDHSGQTGTGPVLHTGDLVRGERVFFCATGVTGSELLRGLQRYPHHTTTQSLALCSNPDTVRLVESEHRHARSADPHGG